MLGESQIVLCGGVDNMSMSPYAVRDIRFGTRLGKAPEVIKRAQWLWLFLAILIFFRRRVLNENIEKCSS